MTMIAARPTTYRGIEMRSRLEATVAQFLDNCKLGWQYEPRAFAGQRGQYLPDFLVPDAMDEGRPLYLEIKGLLVQGKAPWRRMAIIWESEPDARLGIMARAVQRRDGSDERIIWASHGFGTKIQGDESVVFLAWALCGCGAVTAADRDDWHCRACGSPELVAWLDPFSWRPSA